MNITTLPTGDRTKLERALRAADQAKSANLAEVAMERRGGLIEIALVATDGEVNQLLHFSDLGETVAYLYGLESAWIEARNAAV